MIICKPEIRGKIELVSDLIPNFLLTQICFRHTGSKISSVQVCPAVSLLQALILSLIFLRGHGSAKYLLASLTLSGHWSLYFFLAKTM